MGAKNKNKRTVAAKPKTVDRDFTEIQRDLIAILKDIATKSDIRQICEEVATMELDDVKRELTDVRHDVEMVKEIMVSKTDVRGIIRRELEALLFAKESEVKLHADRLAIVERKLGINPSRHNAAS